MIVELVAILMGIGLHQTKRIIESLDTETDTVPRFASYGVGYVGIYPLFALYLRLHDMSKQDRQIAAAGYWIAGVMVGIGVFIGYVIDHFWRGK